MKRDATILLSLLLYTSHWGYPRDLRKSEVRISREHTDCQRRSRKRKCRWYLTVLTTRHDIYIYFLNAWYAEKTKKIVPNLNVTSISYRPDLFCSVTSTTVEETTTHVTIVVARRTDWSAIWESHVTAGEPPPPPSVVPRHRRLGAAEIRFIITIY